MRKYRPDHWKDVLGVKYPEQLAADADYAAEQMRRAVSLPQEEEQEEEIVANGCTKKDCPKNPRKMDVTGETRQKQKGGKGTKGNPNKLAKWKSA